MANNRNASSFLLHATTQRMIILIAAILIACPVSGSAQSLIRGAHNFYVSTTGRGGGAGSLSDPWDLPTALSHPATVRPGDNVWIRGGTYVGNFLSKLTGTATAPIVVRPYNGEHVIIDANNSLPLEVIRVQGGYAWFEDLEITNTNSNRLLLASGSNPSNRRGDGFGIYGPQIKVINCLVHDTANGFGLWSLGVDSELYGNIVFNTGWEAPDRSHGHGIYAQNETGIQRIRENIVFNPFGNVMQVYGSSAAHLNNYLVEGNVLFNGRILIGGNAPARNIGFVSNYLYRQAAEFGYNNRENDGLAIIGNYLPSGIFIKWWKNVVVTGNTFSTTLPNTASVSINPQADNTSLSGYTFDKDTYIEGVNGDIHVYVAGMGYPFSFAKWQSMGFESAGTLAVTGKKRPTGILVFVRPNQYERGRGHIIVYNWDHKDSVTVDLSTLGFASGDEFEVRNVQNYNGQPLTGQYDGNLINLPLTSESVGVPYGFDKPKAPSTLPEFGVFLIRRVSGSERRLVERPKRNGNLP